MLLARAFWSLSLLVALSLAPAQSSADAPAQSADSAAPAPAATTTSAAVPSEELPPESDGRIALGLATATMAPGAELEVVKNSTEQMSAKLMQGAMDVSLPAFASNDRYEIVTPRGTIVLLAAGDYQIDAGTAEEPTRVSVLTGSARVENPGSSVQIFAGQTGTLFGTDMISYMIAPEAPEPLVPPEASTATAGTTPLAAATPPPPMLAVPPPPPSAAPATDTVSPYGSPWGWSWVGDQSCGNLAAGDGRWVYFDGEWFWLPGDSLADGLGFPVVILAFDERHHHRHIFRFDHDHAWSQISPTGIFQFRSASTQTPHVVAVPSAASSVRGGETASILAPAALSGAMARTFAGPVVIRRPLPQPALRQFAAPRASTMAAPRVALESPPLTPFFRPMQPVRPPIPFVRPLLAERPEVERQHREAAEHVGAGGSIIGNQRPHL